MAIPSTAAINRSAPDYSVALMRDSYVLRSPYQFAAGVDAFGRHAAQRVAAFLLQISRNNRYEGRDPNILPDTLTCGFVADLLGLDIPALADVLVALERRGLVEPMDGSGLRLTDPDGLEALANVH